MRGQLKALAGEGKKLTHRLDVAEFLRTLAFAPGCKFGGGSAVGLSCVRIAYVGREELDEAATCRRASGVNSVGSETERSAIRTFTPQFERSKEM